MSDIQPNLEDLIEELQSIRPAWKQFGLFLGISKDELEAIDENKRNVEDKLYALLYKWPQMKPRGTWKDIVNALKKIERLDLAGRLEEKYIKHNLLSSDTSYKRLEPTSTLALQCQTAVTSPDPADDNTEITHVDEPQNFMEDVDDLASQFTYLLTEMQSALKQKLDNEELDLDQLGRFISYTLDVSYEPFRSSERRDNIDALFSQFRDFLSFLHTRLLHRIDRRYLDCKFKNKIARYDGDIAKFMKSTTIVAFKEMIHSKGLDKGIPVILRLNRHWEKCTLHNLHHLTEYLFEDSSSLLQFSEIHHSVLTIKYTVPRSLLLSLLIMASRKVRAMKWAGVLSIQVDTILMTVSTNETGIDPSSTLLDVAYHYYDDQITNDIHLLVNIGGDVNTTGFDKITPLGMAALVNNVAAVYALLQSKANPDIQDNDGGVTALYIGSEMGHHQCVDLLLQAKANPDIQTNNGATALYIGSQNGHHQCVDLLLQAKANPDIQANNGATALHIGSQMGHHQCVDLLLQAKANPDIQDSNGGVTALYIGNEMGHHQCVDLLLQAKANPDIQTNNGATALYIGSENGHHQCVDLLLQAKANPDIQDSNGATALYIGSQNGHHQCVDLLLQAKANPDIQANNGATALHIGSQMGHHQCVDLLLQAKANPDIQDSNGGVTALYIGNEMGHHQCVDLLLQAKANPDIQTNNGATALYIGSENGHHQCVDLLLQAKANPDIQDSNGATALYIGSQNGHHQCVDLLLQAKANPDIQANNGATALHIGSQMEHHQCVDLLLQAKANPDIQDSNGVTALYIGSQNGHHQCVDLLLQAKANPDIQDNNGATAMYIGSQMGNHQCVDLLLQAKANPDIHTKDGATPLHCAVFFNHHQLVSMLLEHNANPNYSALGVGCPLAFACNCANVSIVSLLLRYGALVDMPGVPSPLVAAVDKDNYDIAKSLINAGANVNVQEEKIGATPLMIASARGNLSMVQLLLQSGTDVTIQSKIGYTAYDAAKGCQHQKILTLLTIKSFEQAQKYLSSSEEYQESEIVTSPQYEEILLESQSSDTTPQFNSSENVSQPHKVNNDTQMQECNQFNIETIRNHFNSMLDSLQASYKSFTKNIKLIFENQHGFQQHAY